MYGADRRLSRGKVQTKPSGIQPECVRPYAICERFGKRLGFDGYVATAMLFGQLPIKV